MCRFAILCLGLSTLLPVAIHAAVGAPTCLDAEHGSCNDAETEAARFDLLQHNAAVDARRSSKREKFHQVYKPTSVQSCPRRDASSVTFEDLVAMEVPTVLSNAFPKLDYDPLNRSNFIGQGQWANLTVAYDSFVQLATDKFMSESEKITLSEYLNRFTTRNVKLLPNQTTPWIRAIMDAYNGVEPLGFKILQSNMVLNNVNSYSGTLSQKWQVSPMHTHNTALVAQISGRKGWIWGNTGTYGVVSNHDLALGSGIPSNPPSDDEICDVWRTENQTAFDPEKFLFCESQAGDVMVGPGLCGGLCGWWHATCGLDDWQASFIRVGPLRDEDTNVVGIRGRIF